MAKVSVSEAARLAGVSRVTMQRHIKKGKVSKTEGEDGNPVVDTSELLRVYGELKTVDAPMKQSESSTPLQVEAATKKDDAASKIALLEQKINFLEQERDTERERRREAEKRIAEERAEKERLFTLAESTTRLLEAPKQQPEPSPQQPEKKPGLWQRITGG